MDNAPRLGESAVNTVRRITVALPPGLLYTACTTMRSGELFARYVEGMRDLFEQGREREAIDYGMGASNALFMDAPELGCTAHRIHQSGIEEGLLYTPARAPHTVLAKCDHCNALLPAGEQWDDLLNSLGKGVRLLRRARYSCPYSHTVWSHGVVLGWMIGRLEENPGELFGECRDCESWLPP